VLRFKIGSIPVTVHPSHFLFSAVLGLSWVGSSEALAGSQALHVGLWVGIIFVSVLVHELGHATVSLAFGYRPEIQLVGMGGATTPNSNGPIPWIKDIALTLAGPGFGFALGAFCYVLGVFVAGRSPLLDYVLTTFFWANLVWAIYNLLPVTPLDGGRISSAFLMRVFGKVGFLFAQLLSVAVSGGMVLLAIFVFKEPFVAIFMGMYSFRSFTLIAAYLRGEAPASPATPNQLALSQAAALFKDGKLDEARKLGALALEGDLLPAVRAQAHHLLGWVELKAGNGRAALDHFSQAQGQHVEPQALAGAFSLIGDDERAVTLWELASRETRDSGILHEWAATLIRLGREDQLRRIPGVDAATAYAFAERMLFKRGEFAQAARLGEQALALTPRPEVAYDTACAHARAGDVDAAVRLLDRAAQLGFNHVDHATVDPDLLSLRGHPPFEDWLNRLRNSVPA
jgi:Zn-dependent protease